MADNLPAVATEIATIESGMRTDLAAYMRDVPTQERYRDLIRARDGGGPAPASPSPVTARRREIEKMMADPRSGYWRDEALQAEYYALVSGQQREARPAASSATAAGPPGEQATIDAAAKELAVEQSAEIRSRMMASPEGRALLAEWGADAAVNIELAFWECFGILADMAVKSPAEAEAMGAFVDALSPAAYAVLMKDLSWSSRLKATI